MPLYDGYCHIPSLLGGGFNDALFPVAEPVASLLGVGICETAWALVAVLVALIIAGVRIAFIRFFGVPHADSIWKRFRRGKESGIVYVLSNPSMPGLVKVGFTTRRADIRANELWTTGVPTRFVVEWYMATDHAERVESQAHRLMAKYRVNRYREFFRLPPSSARRYVEKARGHVLRSRS